MEKCNSLLFWPTLYHRLNSAFWGLKNLKLIFNVFIQKIPKNYNAAYGEN